MGNKLKLGVGIGSTTAKLVLMDGDKAIYRQYKRHLSEPRQTVLEMIQEMQKVQTIEDVSVTVSGSAGMGMGEEAGLPFVQEVYATSQIVEQMAPDTGVVIELGGEDAKVVFFDGGVDERYEWLVCRRHRCFYRPNGCAAQYDSGRNGYGKPLSYPSLSHCFSLRRVCQNRHSATS